MMANIIITKTEKAAAAQHDGHSRESTGASIMMDLSQQTQMLWTRNTGLNITQNIYITITFFELLLLLVTLILIERIFD